MLSFRKVATALLEIEKLSRRLEMTAVLAELFKKSQKEEIGKLVYIIQGILAPPYEGIDLGLGEKFALAAIAGAAGYSKAQVEANYKKSGDLGTTAELLLEKKAQKFLAVHDMDVTYVYNAFIKLARLSGTGSQDLKIKYLTLLLNNASALEARFITRFVLGRLRLGVGDPTILDALSMSRTGDKSLREELERAFNVCSDLGHVAKIFFTDPKEIAAFHVSPFRPLMPALAERLSTPKEIAEKLGICAVEMKLDGFRMQVHKKGGEVEIYSRSLEKITHMFPEVVQAAKELKKADEIIFEGEALAYNEKENRYYSFQETMQRKRKYGIGKAQKEFPLNVFCFDIIYLNGHDLTFEPYEKRRAQLEKIFPSGPLKLGEMKIVENEKEIESIFTSSVERGLEGIIAKDLRAPYTAGKRKFAWIKLKRSYGKAMDTVDAVIVGYFLGKGARVEFEFGGLLVAVYNEDKNRLQTIAKIGSGYTEEEMVILKEMLEKITTASAPEKLDWNNAQKPDFWVQAKYVVEAAFDDITLSPTHTCGMKEGKGYALRFPRMLKMRDDKSVSEITTTREVIGLYEKQKNRS